MPSRPSIILGINPGSRYLGVAVFQGPWLCDWRIKVFKGRWSAGKLRQITRTISSLIARYQVKTLAIKKLHPARTSGNLIRTINAIREIARNNHLKVCQYSIQDLERHFSPDDPVNKKKLAGLVAAHYPELYLELEKEKAGKNPYRLRMFEAVALAALVASKLDKH